MRLIKKLFGIFIDFLTIFLRVLYSNWLIVLSLLMIYVIMGLADQGQDMMININSYYWGPLSLYLVLGSMSLIHWQFPKFFSEQGLALKKFSDIFTQGFNSPVAPKDDPENTAKEAPADYKEKADDKEKYIRIVPRLLGVLTWLLPAYCVIKAMNKYNVPTPGVNEWYKLLPSPGWYLLITMFLFGLSLWQDWFVHFYTWLLKKKKGNYYYATICTLLAVSPFAFWPLNYGLPSNQVYIFIGFTLYALLFAMLTSTRWLINEHSKVRLVCFLFKDRTITRIVWILAFLGSAVFLVFVLCNAFNIVARYTFLFTLAIVLCGVIFYLVVITLLQYKSKRSGRNYLALTLIIMMLLVKWNPNFYHRVEPLLSKQGALTVVPTLKEYMKGWINSRKAGLDSNSKFPIILVNTYGGGIRAAAWTCLVVNRLDSLTGGAFQKHVFCYSGASGGTIGASILCANGFNTQFNNMSSYAAREKKYHDFYTRYDYLTADLVGLLGNDVLYSILPGNRLRDRAVLQTTSWEKAYKNCFGESIYDQDFFSLWNSMDNGAPYQVPLLFSNASETTKGYKGIIAPVALNASDFIGDELISKLIGNDTSIKLSTAAFISARFPYISPAGQLGWGRGSRYFIDGGAKENSGAETNFAVFKLLDSVLKESFPDSRDRFPVICISLKNSNMDDIRIEEDKKISQLTAPISSIVNGGINGATEKADSINRFKFKPNYFLFFPQAMNVVDTGYNIFNMQCIENTKPVLPLGWQISDLAMLYMEKSINDNTVLNTRENNIPNFIKALDSLSKR